MESIDMLKVIYWVIFSLIVYVYMGYPFLLLLIRRIKGKKDIKEAEHYPAVSLIMAVYNEEAIIRKRIENILLLSYPKDKLEVLIISDACSDSTDSIVKEYEDKDITLFGVTTENGI